MKALRIIAIAILTVMLLSLPVYAEDTSSGLSFAADAVYRVNKAYEESPATFEAWVKVAPSVTDRAGVIIGNYGSGNPNVSFEIHTDGAPRLYITDAGGKVYDHKFTAVSVNTGEWTHVAITYSPAERMVRCYINGALKQETACAYGEDIKVSTPLGVGGDHRSGNAQYFKGEIRSIAVYSDARTADEIAADKTEYGADGLIASYDLTSVRDGRIADGSGNNYDVSYKATWIDPEDKAPVSGYAYSFAVVGDTQRIAYNYKSRFGDIYDWILENAEEKKTKFVFGLGDITETSSDEEWQIAMDAIGEMDGRIPYSLVRGNHDSVTTFKKYVSYNTYKNTVGGSYDSSMLNTYQELTVGEMRYLILTLDYGASDRVLAWASDVISDHPYHNVIITTHAYLYRDGTTLDDGDVCPPSESGGYNDGDDMWDKLIKKHENIVLVMSGHDPCDNIIMTQTEGENGNTVTQMLIDPQGADNTYEGLGAVAMLYFSEDGKNVTVEYYSTFKEKFFMSDSQFTMTLDVIEYKETEQQTQKPTDTEKPTETQPAVESYTGKPTETTLPATDEPTESEPTDINVDRGCALSASGVWASAVCAIAACGCLVKRKKRR